MSNNTNKVIVLNASFEVMAVVPIHRALLYIYKEKAEIVKAREGETIRTSSGEVAIPLVVRWNKMVKLPYANHPLQFSRRKVLERDNWECCYCGKRASTIDHVQPRSKGGGLSFMNCVASCQPCNSKKGNKTPQEAGMPMRYQPRIVYKRESIVAAVAATGFDLDSLYAV